MTFAGIAPAPVQVFALTGTGSGRFVVAQNGSVNALVPFKETPASYEPSGWSCQSTLTWCRHAVIDGMDHSDGWSRWCISRILPDGKMWMHAISKRMATQRILFERKSYNLNWKWKNATLILWLGRNMKSLNSRSNRWSCKQTKSSGTTLKQTEHKTELWLSISMVESFT